MKLGWASTPEGSVLIRDPPPGTWLTPGVVPEAAVLATGTVSYRLCATLAVAPPATTYTLQQ